MWKWIGKIASLEATKIVWPEEEFNDPNSQKFIITIDGIDCNIQEKNTDIRFNVDKKMCSHKHTSAGIKYEIAMSVFDSKCVWVNGPFRGGKHDLKIYEGTEDEHDERIRKKAGLPPPKIPLRDMIPEGKLGIADRGYRGAGEKVATPESEHSQVLAKFMSRARCRHETFNGRLKFYKILEGRFRHTIAQHCLVFLAICTTVQYQMDHGAELFVV